MLLLVGLVEFVAASALTFYQDRLKRAQFVQLLLGCLVFDGLLMHNPLFELDRSLVKESTHVVFDSLIAAGLLMTAGFRRFE